VISPYPLTCSDHSVIIFNQVPEFLRNASLANYGATSRCNLTFGISTNETEIGSYLLSWTTGDSSKINIVEDNDMLIALVIGISVILLIFIILTSTTKDDRPFLANFFFIGIFIFSTVLSNLIWKITNVNSSPYEPIMLVVYRMMLIITFLIMLIVLVLITIESVKIRRIAGNPVDNYRDNLGKNE